jgi:fucose 4-O-acetylase-like acetyltransferase
MVKVEKLHITAIDDLKGILILLVIIGHLVLGTLDDNLLRYTIYTFHMPLFMAIGGYLLNLEKLQKMNIVELWNKYVFRLIVPWVIAVFVFYCVRNYAHFSFIALLKEFAYPFYHLWFIPAFLLFIFIHWIFLKTKLPVFYLLIFAFTINILLKTVSFENNLMRVVLHTVRPSFFFYFCLAVCLKVYSVNVKGKYLSLLLLITTLLNFYFFFNHNVLLKNINAWILNSCLVILTLTNLTKLSIPFSKFFSWLGINSLAIYLWHIFPILLSRKLTIWGGYYYLLTIISIIICTGLIYILSKNKIINKYIFGIAK